MKGRFGVGSQAIYVALIGFSALLRVSAAEPWVRHTIDDSSRGADGVRLADANGDGLLDIATPWEQGGLTRVYFHPGYANVRERWPLVTVGQTPQAEDAVFADLDGDGALDVITSCEGNERVVYIHWAPAAPDAYGDSTAWRTQAIPASKDVAQWMYCLPRDVDGDGDTDLVMGSKHEGAGVGFLVCPDSPRDMDAWRWKPLYEGGWIMSLQGHDIDLDGDEDILLSDRRGPNSGVVWLRRDANPVGWNTLRIGPVGEAEAMFLWGGRFEPGGPFHVVVGSKRDRMLYHYTQENGGNGWQMRSSEVPDGVERPKGVAVADLDMNGDLEVVLSCEGAEGRLGLVALRLDTFELAWDIGGLEGAKFDRIELIDLDGDGDLDVLTCEEREGLGVIWYENPVKQSVR